MRYIVGFKVDDRADRVIVESEDALAAALNVKDEKPRAVITYVRAVNRRGDARHPSHGLGASAPH
jgi:hypothetical protein